MTASSEPAAPTPFAYGVASFDPLANGVLLWTHATSLSVAWRISESVGGESVAEGVADVDPDSGCVTVDVSGLRPATTYHYWFETVVGAGVLPTLSPVGRTRTLPDGAVDWFRLAVVCCADRSMGVLPAYRAIADDEVDLVLHLGDYIYETPKGPHRVEPDDTCVTLVDYRRRHANTRADRDLQTMHLRHPMVFVWDDHDVADNAWRHGAKAHDPERHGPWEERLVAAARARQEWLPARLVDPTDLLSMRRSFALGELAELVVSDTRIPGRDLQWGDDGAKPLEAADRALVDAKQREWMLERIVDRARPWCLFASQVPVAELELPVPASALVDDAMPSGYRVIDGEAACTDLWEGYPVERQALVDAISRRGPGVVVLSGDVHSSWASMICDEDDRSVAVDFVCPAVSATEMGQHLPPGWRKAAEKVARDVPHQVWHDLERHGYVHVDVRPDHVRADWYAIETDAHGGIPERLASFAVDHAMPAELRVAEPSSPLGAAEDLQRPGLARESLPAPEPPPPRRRSLLMRVAMIGAVAAALSIAAIALRRLRRR